MQHKTTKREADYRMGRHGHKCGECAHYYAGKCSLVEGSIDPEMSCKYFTPDKHAA